jgi:MscS family membrane protein
MRWPITLTFILSLQPLAYGQSSPPAKPDPLDRDNPRSAVTGFLESARDRNYQRASEYLDLQEIPVESRAERGPQLARELEAILNSDSHFSVLQLSRDPEGSNNSGRERVTTVTKSGENFPVDLERKAGPNGASRTWLFASDSVSVIPKLTTSVAPPWIAHFLPPFLMQAQLLETPLWKWIALILVALFLLSVWRLLDRLLTTALQRASSRFGRFQWMGITVQPLQVMFYLAIFRVAEELINPAAIARIYVGRVAQLLLVWTVASALIRLVGLLFHHLETILDGRRGATSRSMLLLGRRTANATISVFAILLVLSNWGYNTNTLIAGLGVGGIAIALAAQQTIANIFGGVSIIGDHPIGIGEFGKFGDLVGTVEDIGMRSTRVRTVNRTLVSVPNSSFAALNLENYSERDKILFNPVLEVKRTAADEEVRQVMQSLQEELVKQELVDPDPGSVRLIGLTAAAFRIEISCYVRTSRMDEFYQVQDELYLAIDQVLKQRAVELV